MVCDEAGELADPVGELLVDDVHELVDRPVAEPVAADTAELPGRVGVHGLEHVLHRATHEDLAAQGLETREPQVAEVLIAPALGELARCLGLPGLAEHADRDDLTVAAVERLVGAEPRLPADLLSEALVDTAHEVLHQPLMQAVAPDACEHFAAPFLLGTTVVARVRPSGLLSSRRQGSQQTASTGRGPTSTLLL